MIIEMMEGIQELISWNVLIFLNIGIFLGIIIGAIPGLGVMLAIAVLLPVTFSLDPVPGIVMLLGLYCAGTYGGSISAILLNAPGTPAAAATLLDGYPLFQRGEAKKALMMSLIASVTAGLISAVILIGAAPQLAKVTMMFGAPEYFSLAVFGLSIIASVAGKDILKGLIGGCLGLFIATIGLDPATAVPRFTFGQSQLVGGIALIPALIGLFAFSEVLNKVNKPHVEKNNKDLTVGESTLNRNEWKKSSKTIVKSSLIGTIIGIIPGTGGTSGAFISHNEARRSSKHPDRYGKGEIDGIAAAEAGNNGVTGATLIPLLTLGIPGDGATAVLLGAFMMNGLTPGPALFEDHGSIIYAVMFGLLIVNVFMFLQARVLINQFARVSKLDDSFLAPILILTCTAGVFAESSSIFHVNIALGFGLLAYFLIKFGFSPVPVLLGIVLGPILESNLLRAMTISEGDPSIFITRPISLFFLILTFAAIIVISRANKKTKNA
ncbi:tripartite tricarboxylate transporter permease [Salibacterium aidingense]|uniref:tripartite tricarboxylate transporter permease n=1 Tax=Salibacterium aidingense TaxID=384933 RepID=UPI003BBC4AC8